MVTVDGHSEVWHWGGPASLWLSVFDLLTPGRGTDEDCASHGDGDTVLSTGTMALCRTGRAESDFGSTPPLSSLESSSLCSAPQASSWGPFVMQFISVWCLKAVT